MRTQSAAANASAFKGMLLRSNRYLRISGKRGTYGSEYETSAPLSEQTHDLYGGRLALVAQVLL